MKKKNTYVRMDARPSCDFCHREADYDGLTLRGMWGYMCKDHFSSINAYIPLWNRILERTRDNHSKGG